MKDESKRFGLNAFKGLGASYAIYRFIKKSWEERFGKPFDLHKFKEPALLESLGIFTFTSATDGNHGRAVAWTARKLKQKAVIYVPSNMVQARREVLRQEGAEVIVIDGTYDDAVKGCAEDAERYGRQIVSDTSWPGYEEIPRWVSTGYSTLFKEIDENLAPSEEPTLVFMQAAVGAFACAGSDYYVKKLGESRPRLICVQPLEADCILESVISIGGERAHSRGRQDSMMACLNCGTPSMIAWPILKESVDLFLAVDDEQAVKAMRTFYYPEQNDPQIISGESGSAGLAGLLSLVQDENLKQVKQELRLDPSSVVLLINTEGNTDPANFEAVIKRN